MKFTEAQLEQAFIHLLQQEEMQSTFWEMIYAKQKGIW